MDTEMCPFLFFNPIIKFPSFNRIELGNLLLEKWMTKNKKKNRMHYWIKSADIIPILRNRIFAQK